MKPPLDNSMVMITGASSGIGREFAIQLAGRVKGFVLVARRTERLNALKEELLQQHAELKIHVQTCDLSDSQALKPMVDEVLAAVGQVDVLVNNAGLGDIELFERSKLSKLELMLRVNMLALTQLTHLMLPPMLERQRGAILNVSSGFGLTFMPMVASYAGTKAYVTSFTESLRSELRGTGVLISQLCPGPVATEFEAVAGNPTNHGVPGFVELSAEQCVRSCLRQFNWGKALIITGFWIRVVMWITRLSPRLIKRAAFSWIGRFMRRRKMPQ